MTDLHLFTHYHHTHLLTISYNSATTISILVLSSKALMSYYTEISTYIY